MALKIEGTNEQITPTPTATTSAVPPSSALAVGRVVLDTSVGEKTMYSPLSGLPAQSAAERATLAENERRKAELLSIAQALTVASPDSLQFAADLRRDIRKLTDWYEAHHRPNIQRLHKAHTDALAELKRYLDPLTKIDAMVKRKQDEYQILERRKKDEERKRLEAEMAAARERVLAQQLEEAAARNAPQEIEQVFERMAAPPPAIPVVHVPVKAEGSSARTMPTVELIDAALIDPIWLLRMVLEEVREKGACEWLDKALRRELKRSGAGVADVVGRGSVKYDEVVSTGVRR